MSDDPLSAHDRNRLAIKLWGPGALDERGQLYASSSDQELELLRERVRELRGRPSVSRAQRTQLELIRDRRFNHFDGEQVVRDLLIHRGLWVSALMDRVDPMRLIKLRDLPRDHWNVDMLYLLARDEASAHALAELSETWRADTVEIFDTERTGLALGQFPVGDWRIVELWWD